MRTTLALALAIAASAVAADKSGTRPNVINVPSGPGSLNGLGENLEVSLNSGTVKETIGLALPPGTAGHTPHLALSYDGGGANGSVGLGWSLQVSSIQLQTEKGLPRYDGTDGLLLDGSEVVALADGTFRLRFEGAFVRIRRSGAGFEVDLPGGGVRRYGIDPSSRIADGVRIFAWYLEDDFDVFGNRISYFYEKHGGQPYLVEVQYNRRAGAADNGVLFDYSVRPDPSVDYRAGYAIAAQRRLSGIRVFAKGERVRRYALSYTPSASLSLLASVTLFGDDDATALPAVEFSYTSFNPTADASKAMLSGPARLPGNDSEVELTDVDGDSFPDVLIAASANHFWHRNVGGHSFESARAMPSSPAVSLATAGVELADIDADGLVDLVAKTGTTASAFRYFPNKGTGAWEPSVVFSNNPSFAIEDGSTRWADLDHDKRVDAYRLSGSGATWWRNIGGGAWSDAQTAPLPPGGTSLDLSDQRVQLQDINGDRLVDLAFVRSGSVLLWHGKGRGNFESPVSIANAPDPGSELESRLRMADLNGDGMADLFLVQPGQVDYWLQVPGPAFDVKRTLSGTPYADPALTAVRTGDMNANGTVDLVWFSPTAAVDERVVYLDVQSGVRPNLLREVRNGLGKVQTIAYGSAGSAFQEAADEGRPWTTRLPIAVPVVTETSLSDSREGTYVTRYQYANGYYDGTEREFRGFAKVVRSEPGETDDPTIVSEHLFDVGQTSAALKGQLLETVTRGADGTVYVRSKHTVVARQYALGVDGRAVEGVERTESSTFWTEGSATPIEVREGFVYDDFGNVTIRRRFGRVIGGDPLLGADESFEVTAFINDTARWILGRPYEERTITPNGALVSHQRHYYDGDPFVGLPLGQLTRGLQTRSESWLSEDRWIDSHRASFDAYGNEISTLSPRGARREVDYDEATHTLPVAERVFINDEVTLEYRASYKNGRPLLESFIEPNGAVTRFSYDALERITAIVKPGDTAELPSARYSYVLASPVSTLRSEERRVSGEDRTTVTLTHQDGLGRQLAKVVQAEGGRWVVAGRREFSRKGAVLREWDDYFTESEAGWAEPPPSLQVRYAYDALGRKIRTDFPDGRRVEVRHGPLWEERWDAEDVTAGSVHYDTPTRLERDGLERTIATVERLGNQALITRFVYDAESRLTAVSDAVGRVTSYEYDGAGRRLALNHPEGGRRTYEYDADDNVVRSNDAAGNSVAWTFDLAGRPLTETLVEGGTTRSVIRYHYDGASPRTGDQNSIGRLSWVEDEAGEAHFAYDVRGRLVEETRLIGGKAFTTRQRYDNLDHVTALTYPDGVSLEYQFNERGLLRSVPGVLRHLEYNAAGLPVRREYANGVSATAVYDEHDRVHSIESRKADGATLQHLQYDYDGAGTLTRIQDFVHPDGRLSAAWQFSYDSLYRLSRAEGPRGAFSHDYDAIGNLLQKSDVGTFAYDPANKPSAVRSVAGRPISYNENGAIVGYEGKSLSYDARGFLRRVETDKGVTEYVYDYEGTRTIKRVTSGGKTRNYYYLDRFTEERDGQLVKYVFSGDVRLARIGGGTPRSVQAAGMVAANTLRGFSALGAVSMLAGLFALMFGRLREQRRKLIAAGVALALSGCGGCGNPDAPFDGAIFYLADHLGSSQVLTDTSGNVVSEASYDPWGAQVSGTDEPYTFAGNEWDAEAGLYAMGARYYDPVIGRFTQVDPMAMQDPLESVEDPQALNPYSYARNTPTSLKDRDGKLPHILIGALAGAVINTGIYLAKGAINGESYSAKGALAAAASGAVAGAVTAATGGAGLLVSGMASGAAGGVVDRGINTGSLKEALNPDKIAGDALSGAVGSVVGAGAAKVVGGVVKKVAGAVQSRMGAGAKEVSRSAGPRPVMKNCPASFVAGTLVLLASGEFKPIEQIAAGEFVAAPASLSSPSVLHGYEVVATFDRVATNVIDLVVENENGHREAITTTAEHPFARWTRDAIAWVPAVQLNVGDALIADGSIVWVQDVSWRSDATRVFNLSVDAAESYVVGLEQLLVHNCKVTYSRPSNYRKGVREKTWKENIEVATGQVRDPKTGRFMSKDKPWDMGHKPGFEHRKHAASAERRGIDRKQYLDEHNDPSNYRPELPSSNRSHKLEAPEDVYHGK